MPSSSVKKTNDRVDGDQDDHGESERAELQKQTAVNKLNASEIKRQLIENQAVEYYS